MPLIMGFTSRSVNLSWAPSVDNHNSPILHYIIHVRHGTDVEENILQFPALVIQLTFGPTDLTSTYSVCTWRVFGATGTEPRPSDPKSGALTTRLPTAIESKVVDIVEVNPKKFSGTITATFEEDFGKIT
ncbi:hypothetical protein TNCV_2996111 [Trichonephila clavipes]|nr:hypothetical protein TNCV_2996111 [Trichonephila clavipes]